MGHELKGPSKGPLSVDTQLTRGKYSIEHKFLRTPHLQPMIERKRNDGEFLVKFKNKFGPIAIRKRMIEDWKKRLQGNEYQHNPEKYNRYINEKYISTFFPQLELSKEAIIKKNGPGCPLIVKNGPKEYDLPVEIFWNCLHVDLTSKFQDPSDVIANVQTFLEIFGTKVTVEE